MNKTIGILAHVDAGKTTFSESLLYLTNSTRKRGRVDHKDSYLDNHQIEQERGITIFSGQAVIQYQGDTYFLIDTPGHADFSPEMERSLAVMDYAILIISAVEGVQGHTETIWKLLQKYQIPVFFFINKTDRDTADPARVLEEIRANFSEDVCWFSEALEKDGVEENSEYKAVLEFMAERDVEFLDLYLEGKHNKPLCIETMRKMIHDKKLYICSGGSALFDQGIEDFFANLHLITATHYSDTGFDGKVYRIGHDKNGTRITYLKITGGTLKVRDEIITLGENGIKEKVTQIRIYHGDRFENVDWAEAGQLVGVTGLAYTRAGQALGSINEERISSITPTLRAKVIFDPSLNVKELVRIFNILNEEDPSLNVTWEEGLQEIHIQVMGSIQLEILESIIRDRFDLDVKFGYPNIIYKETINGSIFGYGHFEPLGHYAEVHLKIEESGRDTGIRFENLCHTDDLSRGNQNLVKQHIFEKEHKGLLTGSPLTDLKISLLTGRAHNQHTSGGDFRQATYRALRQGLEKAELVLLEPYYDFKIKADLSYIGRVISDIQKAKGSCDTPETTEDKAIIIGRVPVATFMNYTSELAAYTGGKGTISLVFGGYDICHNSEQVIERIGYNKDADPEYSSASIFCTKGQAYTVLWKEAEERMHCTIKSE